jgi:hypothetical protein
MIDEYTLCSACVVAFIKAAGESAAFVVDCGGYSCMAMARGRWSGSFGVHVMKAFEQWTVAERRRRHLRVGLNRLGRKRRRTVLA